MPNKTSKLRSFRYLVGASEQELAEAVGTNQSTISRLERLGPGRAVFTDPKLSLALRIYAWADVEAKRRKVPRDQRLTLDDLDPTRIDL